MRREVCNYHLLCDCAALGLLLGYNVDYIFHCSLIISSLINNLNVIQFELKYIFGFRGVFFCFALKNKRMDKRKMKPIYNSEHSRSSLLNNVHSTIDIYLVCCFSDHYNVRPGHTDSARLCWDPTHLQSPATWWTLIILLDCHDSLTSGLTIHDWPLYLLFQIASI